MGTSWLFRAIFAGSLAAGIVACTVLTGVGDLSVVDAPDAKADTSTSATVPVPDSSPPDQGPPDSGSLVGDDESTVVDACSPSGCLDVPPGFSLVALGPPNGACPNGFEDPAATVESVTVDPAACQCGCTVTDAGRCPSTGTVFESTASPTQDASTCSGTSESLSAGCSVDGYGGPFGQGYAHRYVPPSGGPTGQTCTGSAQKDPTKVQGTPGQLCQAQVVPSCNGQICPPDVSRAGYQACIAAPGDVSCPSAWPTKHLLGSAVSFDCDGTGCSCPSSTGSCSGHMLYYTSYNCTGTPGYAPIANGQCIVSAPDASGTTFISHEYVPDPPTNVTCTAGGTATATNVTLAQETTVCCTN